CQNERGTMAMVTQGPIKELYFGFTADALLVRVDCDAPARTALHDFDALRVGFTEPAGYELLVRKAAGEAWAPQLFRQGQPAEAPDVEVAVEQIVELRVPFARLGVTANQPIQFYVELLEGQQSRDRAPREGTINLTCPSPHFE